MALRHVQQEAALSILPVFLTKKVPAALVQQLQPIGRTLLALLARVEAPSSEPSVASSSSSSSLPAHPEIPEIVLLGATRALKTYSRLGLELHAVFQTLVRCLGAPFLSVKSAGAAVLADNVGELNAHLKSLTDTQLPQLVLSCVDMVCAVKDGQYAETEAMYTLVRNILEQNPLVAHQLALPCLARSFPLPLPSCLAPKQP